MRGRQLWKRWEPQQQQWAVPALIERAADLL